MKKIILFMFLTFAVHVFAADLTVVTEEWEPYNFTVNGKASGLGVEMVNALLKEAGIKADITFLPWNRAYKMATTDKNVMIFTMGRNEERETMFHWVTRIAPRDIYFYKLKSRADIKAASLNELKRYKIGSSSSTDAGTLDLIKAGFEVGTNLDLVEGTDPDTANLKKLVSGRVDVTYYNPLNLASIAKKENIPVSQLERMFLLSGKEHPGYWVALSKSSDPALVKKLQDASLKLEKAGVFKQILEKYTN